VDGQKSADFQVKLSLKEKQVPSIDPMQGEMGRKPVSGIAPAGSTVKT
jgi:hypothetical protein